MNLPLPLGDWWVDEKGDLHPSEKATSSLDATFFRHLGLVKFCVKNDEVQIQWDSNSVAGDALPSVLDRLFRAHKNKKIWLIFYYFGWVREKYDHPSAAMRRIFEIQQCQQIELIHPSLMSSQNIEDVEQASPIIKQSFKLWEQTKGQFDNIHQEQFSNYLPRILIYRPDKKEENILHSWIGLKSVAVNAYGRKWAKESAGQVSNESFGTESPFHANKASIGIARTMKTGEPSYDHFRVLVDIDSDEPFWVSYERLLTRHALHDGKPGVVCTVNEAQNVNIPLAGGF